MKAGRPAVFDCRLIPLPNIGYVVDYFRWRQEDSHRNSLNGYCYWLLRDQGISATEVQKRISGISIGEKNELLFSMGVNYNDLPSWQKRGVGMFFKDVDQKLLTTSIPILVRRIVWRIAGICFIFAIQIEQ